MVKKMSWQKKVVTRFARATVTKSYQMTSGNTSMTGQESLPDIRLALFKSRRVALSCCSYSRASKCLESAR